MEAVIINDENEVLVSVLSPSESAFLNTEKLEKLVVV